jgi:hypothetical protein
VKRIQTWRANTRKRVEQARKELPDRLRYLASQGKFPVASKQSPANTTPQHPTVTKPAPTKPTTTSAYCFECDGALSDDAKTVGGRAYCPECAPTLPKGKTPIPLPKPNADDDDGEQCPKCGGSGDWVNPNNPNDVRDCFKCRGKGFISARRRA